MSAHAIASTLSKNLVQRLTSIVGEAHLSLDPGYRELLSHDVFYQPENTADLVVAPGSSEELAKIMIALNDENIKVNVRGGGMSYTDAYAPQSKGVALLDMSRMNRILEINERDMYVTVEAGCTWEQLNTELEKLKLRTPFWGPLSGLISTIGGGLSQNNAFFGGSIWGTTSESLISLKVITADGTCIETGSASTKGARPFYRYYGPDLTGLFTGDAGALGVKAEATFRLIRRPAKTGFASFEFDSADSSASAMSELSREGLGAELFGFDPGLTKMAMSRGTWSDNLKTVKDLAKAEDSALASIKQVAKTVVAGKSIVHRGKYSMHVICDGRSKEAIQSDLAAARAIVSEHGGKETDNSIAKVVRAAPFGPVDSMVGPNGERWIPTHGIVSHTDAPRIWSTMVALFDENAEDLEKHSISWGFLTCTVASNGFLIEPVMIWPDELLPMHYHYVRPEHLEGVPKFAPNPIAREFVTTMRKKLVDIFADYKAVHYQIGRAYPYREHRKEETWKLLEVIKSHVDPKGRINPGCLGLDQAVKRSS